MAAIQRVLTPGGPAVTSEIGEEEVMKKLHEVKVLARRTARQAEVALAAATSMAASSASAADAEEAGEAATPPTQLSADVSESASLLLQAVLMQAEISWRLRLTDSAILSYQKAINLAKSHSCVPTKVRPAHSLPVAASIA
jgi:hypothetical protein